MSYCITLMWYWFAHVCIRCAFQYNSIKLYNIGTSVSRISIVVEIKTKRFCNTIFFVMSGFWLKDCCSWVERTTANRGPSQVGVCSDPVSSTESTSVGYWRWSVNFLHLTWTVGQHELFTNLSQRSRSQGHKCRNLFKEIEAKRLKVQSLNLP